MKFIAYLLKNPSRKARELKYKMSPYIKHDDYGFVNLFVRAFENATDPVLKKKYYAELVHSETHRDYHMGSIKQFKTLVQMDKKADTEIKEAKWDLFKISMSDIARNSMAALFKCKICLKNHIMDMLKYTP